MELMKLLMTIMFVGLTTPWIIWGVVGYIIELRKEKKEYFQR